MRGGPRRGGYDDRYDGRRGDGDSRFGRDDRGGYGSGRYGGGRDDRYGSYPRYGAGTIAAATAAIGSGLTWALRGPRRQPWV